MKHPMRRSDRSLPEAEALALLQNSEYGILAAVDPTGAPYAVPLSYAFDGERIYFHGTVEGGRKTDCIRANAQVCFTVVGETRVLPDKFSTVYHSVIAEGRAEILEDEAEKKAALRKLIDKYSPAFLEKGISYIDSAVAETAVYAVTVETISGKARKK